MARRKSLNKGNTQKLQVEVDIMEQRIVGLKQILQSQKESVKERVLTSQGSTRWSAASTNVPLRNYGKHVLEKHREVAKALQKKQSKSKIPSRPSSRSSSISKQQQNPSFLSNCLTNNEKSKVQENLNRALHLQQQYSNEVVKYLTSIKLEQYAGVILDNGFDEMDLLKEIQVDHVKDMSIPPKEARKLLNSIQKLVQEEERKALESAQKIQRLKESQNVQNDGDVYDEELQHKLFLEAVMEYREQSKKVQEEEEVQVDNTILIQDEQEQGYVSSRLNKKEDQQRNKMKFLLSGSSDWQMFDLGLDQNYGTDQQQIIVDRTSCFQCYKLFAKGKAINTVTGKEFCSKECVDQFILQNIYVCRSQSCAKQIKITQGHYGYGQWFCNEECLKQYEWECTNIRGKTNISL